MTPAEGAEMNDKSPRQNMSKKSAKSLKQKRTDKKAKHEGTTTSLFPQPKHH